MSIEDDRLKRMLEIRGWLLGVKVCTFCSLGMAVWQTEQEMGDKSWRPQAYKCGVRDARGTCHEKLERYWPEIQEATAWARAAELLRSGFANSKAEPTSGTGSAPHASSPSEPRPSRPESRPGYTSSHGVRSMATARSAHSGGKRG